MKTWFITGTSSGFGRQLTELLLERGDRVAATARHPASLDDLKAIHGERLWTAVLDVTKTAQIRTVVAEAFAALGRIDVVVSNAGYGLLGPAEELTDEQIDRQIATNLIGSIQVARTVVEPLRNQGGGRIVQLSSMGGLIGFPGMSLYHTTKWGLEGFYEAFGPEVEAFGIHTTLIEPGMARTEFGFGSLEAAPVSDTYKDTAAGLVLGTAMPREGMPGDPRKMAQAIIDLEDSPEPPKRLLLGSDAYTAVHAALQGRLEAVEAQRDITLSSDADDYAAVAVPA